MGARGDACVTHPGLRSVQRRSPREAGRASGSGTGPPRGIDHRRWSIEAITRAARAWASPKLSILRRVSPTLVTSPDGSCPGGPARGRTARGPVGQRQDPFGRLDTIDHRNGPGRIPTHQGSNLVLLAPFGPVSGLSREPRRSLPQPLQERPVGRPDPAKVVTSYGITSHATLVSPSGR